jgi:NTP pyrophosphatase (non-canonical NTP hydrolase)
MIYAERIRQWAHDRNLLTGSDPKSQFVKLMEEAGELAAAIARGDQNEFEDALGDMFVVMTILAAQTGADIEECIAAAWNEIKDRKGRMIEGVFVKEADLPDAD